MQRKLQKSIKTTKERYGTLFDNILEGFQVIDFDYRYLYVNEAVAKQGRSTKEKLTGHTMMEMYPGIEKTIAFKNIKIAMEKRVVRTLENEFEFPDKSKGWFELRIEPIPEGVFILSLDITARKNAEEQQKEQDELKNIFIRTVSHQLRTPLSVIRWNLERLLRGTTMSRQTQEEMLRISLQANVDVISRIMDLVLAMDIQKADVEIKKEPVHLEEILKSAISELESQFHISNIKLTVEYPKKALPVIEGDFMRLHDIFMKLIQNALTYTREKGRVQIKLSRKKNNLRFEIKDNGIGIPQVEQKYIFNRFYRASNAVLAETDATGLGLYVAKYFVEKHGGRIGFKSQERRGTTFWVEFPANL